MYVQGLPEDAVDKPLGEHAADLGMKPRAYHRAKELLIACGYLHEWKWQRETGRWTTDQLFANITLTRDEANALRAGAVPTGSPTVQNPTAGSRDSRKSASHYRKDKDGDQHFPHPPPEDPAPRVEAGAGPGAEPEPEPDPGPDRPNPAAPDAPEVPEAPGPADPDVVEAEALLLSLRHQNRDLLLGVREARGLAGLAAEWLRRGVSAADLRHALTAYLPRNGVRSAVGFLRHRLTVKLPVPDRPAPPARKPLVSCQGPGPDHVFRPVGDEVHCGPCRMEEARRAHAHLQRQEPAKTGGPTWRERVAQLGLPEGLPQVVQPFPPS
ncbi:hypothetical protein [Streptomyces sp. NPDC003327]